MDTNKLKNFAQAARRQLMAQVAIRMEQVLRTDSVEIREKKQAVEELRKQIKTFSPEAVVEKVAYTWFNRFCALRFMDVNHYTPVGIVSPLEGFTLPEILQDAKKELVDKAFKVDEKRVFSLINGQTPSSNPQQEAYRLLLVGVCNSYHQQMPFLFPKINDYTELLMPGDLLSEGSVLQSVRETLTPETCRDVEVIGWLYQFYISEKKDEVMARKIAVPKEDIPAVTQLFTPHWIVRYLVENSLGRLWMLNHPDSNLIGQMEYFIKSVNEETDFLKINSPEEIKICDPACGSGHMLTYAFDLLYAIYAEQGYDPLQIPSLIIQNNLFGVEIDERAGQLSAFALTMKAREKDKRFFNRELEPNICVLQKITFTASELDEYKKVVGNDLFTQELWFLLKQFEEADNFGSLIRPQVKNPRQILERLQQLGVFNNLLLHTTNEKVKLTLKQAEFLMPLYQVVVANPPYMGYRNFNQKLKDFLANQYPNVKSDLFSVFIVRNLELVVANGQSGYMSPFVWMFLSSYEELRDHILSSTTIITLVQLEYNAFEGSAIPVCAFVLEKSINKLFEGAYIRLSEFRGSENQAPKTLEAIRNPNCGWFFRSLSGEFRKIPGSLIAFWVSEQFRNVFSSAILLGSLAEPRLGLATTDNGRFLRLWYEVTLDNIGFGYQSRDQALKSRKTWFPYNKGGQVRKWYGNIEYIVNWKNDGQEIKDTVKDKYPYLNGNVDYVVKNRDTYFRESASWSKITIANFSLRYYPAGFIFDVAGPSIFADDKNILMLLLGILNSNIMSIISSLYPTMNYEVGQVANFPIRTEFEGKKIDFDNIEQLISFEKGDWDAFETSWNFKNLPLLSTNRNAELSLADIYKELRNSWNEMVTKVKDLEEKNNRILIELYQLKSEISYEVPLNEITLTCNPYYRYPESRRTRYEKEELEKRLLIDTMKEFISYGVGCMFGRYSLDRPGLILANLGETLENYLRLISAPMFKPDVDNVIPFLEGEWFTDDIVSRFREFLKVTFGDTHFEENLAFLEGAIGKDIRSYYLHDFYNQHVKMYKKRPIYWMFSSPKGSFNTLIYMHRYQPDTVSIVLNQYMIPYREKLSARKSHLQAVSINGNAATSDKNKAIKEVNTINAVLLELKEYEDEILYPLAMKRIKIDLDDGVKLNYAKFGKALKAIAGLSD